jgi:hypothetical protein
MPVVKKAMDPAAVQAKVDSMAASKIEAAVQPPFLNAKHAWQQK